MPETRSWRVPHEPPGWERLDARQLLDAPWELDPLPPFVRSDGSGPPEQQTSVRVCASRERLCVRFECQDRDIWATLTNRDDPIYEEEAVELFLAPGEDDPVRYLEFEVSPDGVLFDAAIYNPDASRLTMTGDPTWDCPGIEWNARRFDSQKRWLAVLVIPWRGITSSTPPLRWRANFFRIERPRDGEAEFSCWSPTFITPADFHQPACFGILEMEALAGAGGHQGSGGLAV